MRPLRFVTVLSLFVAATAAFAADMSAVPLMMNEPAGNVTPSAVNDCSAIFIGVFFNR